MTRSSVSDHRKPVAEIVVKTECILNKSDKMTIITDSVQIKNGTDFSFGVRKSSIYHHVCIKPTTRKLQFNRFGPCNEDEDSPAEDQGMSDDLLRGKCALCRSILLFLLHSLFLPSKVENM